MLPNEDMFNMWVANNITDDGLKERLQERVKVCFNELRDSGFYNADSSKTAEVSGETTNVKKGKKITQSLLYVLECTKDYVEIRILCWKHLSNGCSGNLKITVEPGDKISLCHTLSIVPDIFWYQLIPVNLNVILLGSKNA
jgi:hypothetical protein